ncbi:hypothetical protein B0J11DRAFT_531065 [Dendryphion nanum]|uniref:Secreted protein n=1 Tax=Dendryphion nanum TaxID=256645 RepID=A0A9P9DNA2_9PLEO|nr:hypothetical protein B0J11DRAFT_531065 [Dendryphion nanum]
MYSSAVASLVLSQVPLLFACTPQLLLKELLCLHITHRFRTNDVPLLDQLQCNVPASQSNKNPAMRAVRKVISQRSDGRLRAARRLALAAYLCISLSTFACTALQLASQS